MDNNIELNLVGTFNLIASDLDKGSLRSKVGTSPSLTHTMSIKSSRYVDSATKLPGKRTVVRFDKNVVLNDAGAIAPTSAYVVFTVPDAANDLTADIVSNMKAITQLLGTGVAADGQHQKVVPIVVTGEQ